MILAILLLILLYEDWTARRKLKEHIERISGAQIRAAEQAMQIQREQFEKRQ